MNIMEVALMCPLCCTYSNDGYVVDAHMVAVRGSYLSQLKMLALNIDKMFVKIKVR